MTEHGRSDEDHERGTEREDADRDPAVSGADDDEESTPTGEESPVDRPEWDDEYVDRVADRLMFNYDLEKDFAVGGQSFDLYGEMRLESEKHFFHPSISFAHHESREHLFARRIDRVRVSDLEALVDLGHRLADEWIEANDEHFSTDFTFAVVSEELSPEVRSFVESFKDRTLLKFGYHGHYEVNLLVAAPSTESLALSEGAEVGKAFAVWEPLEPEPEPGLLDLIARRLQI
jgi:hypothetical protein